MKSFKLWVIPFLGLLYACGNNPSPAPGPSPVIDVDGVQFGTGLIKDPDRFYGVMHFVPKRAFRGEAAPAEYDVELDGGKTPVRNQGNCGSCWAFGGTQTFEIGMQKYGGKTIDFSEQDLVGKLFYGCGGGYFTGEFQMKTGQLDEATCPYRASNYKCASGPVVAKALNWGLVGATNRSPTDEELQNAILTYGSVAATVGADNAFGRIKDVASGCPSTGTNHIVTLVGWKTISGKVYFKVKNSWGTTNWGTGGYGYIPRGCWNLAEEASWLSVANVPCQPPKAHLPKAITLTLGDEVRLSVKPETGVTYEWFVGTMKAADGPILDLVGKETTVVLLKAKNACGNAEVMTMATVATKAEKK
jgi:hypothetical protein